MSELNGAPIGAGTKPKEPLPTITQGDIDELASNRIVIRLLRLWEARTEGMSDQTKGAVLLSIFETFRAVRLGRSVRFDPADVHAFIVHRKTKLAPLELKGYIDRF